MGGESLQERVRRRRKNQLRKMLVVFFAFALALGFWLWHSFVYVRTPEYALGKLFGSSGAGRAEAMERYIDLPRLIEYAYDDLTSDMLRYDASLTAETEAKYSEFYRVIKPEMTQDVMAMIARYAANGDWTMPGGADLTKGRQLGIDFERFIERSKLRTTEITALGKIYVKTSTAEAEVSVIDRSTDTPFTLNLLMKRAKEGHWRIVQIVNYRRYLGAIAMRQNNEIANYIAATHDIVARYNMVFKNYQARFSSIVKSSGGSPGGGALRSLIDGEVIPALRERQRLLDEIKIPTGAQYLANLRRSSTELTVAAWTRYLKGMEENSNEERNAAETLLKQAVETDLRITDIIRNNTVSQALPEVP